MNIKQNFEENWAEITCSLKCTLAPSVPISWRIDTYPSKELFSTTIFNEMTSQSYRNMNYYLDPQLRGRWFVSVNRTTLHVKIPRLQSDDFTSYECSLGFTSDELTVKLGDCKMHDRLSIDGIIQFAFGLCNSIKFICFIFDFSKNQVSFILSIKAQILKIRFKGPNGFLEPVDLYEVTNDEMLILKGSKVLWKSLEIQCRMEPNNEDLHEFNIHLKISWGSDWYKGLGENQTSIRFLDIIEIFKSNIYYLQDIDIKCTYFCFFNPFNECSGASIKIDKALLNYFLGETKNEIKQL